MTDDRNRDDLNDIIDPEDVSSAPVSASPSTPEAADVVDPADEVPVPIAMSPAEIDERAQAVEAVRGNARVSRSIDEEPRAEA